MDNLNPINVNVHRVWETVSGRTVLYYAYLLTKPHVHDLAKVSIAKELKTVVTLQNDNFDSIIRELHFKGIITDPKLCTLSLAALPAVDSLFFQSFGTNEPKFNGYNIATASRGDRWKSWIEGGSNHIINILKQIKDVRYKVVDQLFHRGRIVIFEYHIHAPVVMIWFVNTPRIKKTAEFGFISDQARKVYEKRIKKIGNVTEKTKYGLSVIDIIAAPTFDEKPAKDALLGKDNVLSDEDHELEISRRLIGPINFEIICHYLLKNKPVLDRNFLSMLTYLDPISGPHSGVILSDPLIEYMRDNSFRGNAD